MVDDDAPDGSAFDAILRALARAPEVDVRLAAGAHIDRYVIAEHLGAGGMGDVYRAHDPRLGRDVALKLLKELGAPDKLARFTREARALAALSHPNIVAIHDLGEHDGRPFLALELLAGETLRERLRRGPLAVDEALSTARQVLTGLAAAHGLGIVHRDLKPENLFVTRDGRVKLLDFGLAKGMSADALRSQTGVVLGTASYMAPEQVRGEEVDARADVFAFGAVVWELVTGRRAFAAASPVETMHRILADAPAPLDELAPEVGDAVAAVVERCLAKAPEDRYAHADDVLRALDAPGPRSTRLGPRLGYAHSGRLHLGYQVFGDTGTGLELVGTPGFVSNIEHLWEHQQSARFLGELGRRARVVIFDKRGTGLSDRGALAPASADEVGDDLRAVLDAVGMERPLLFGVSEGAFMSIAFAATFPERVRGMVLFGGFAEADAPGVANLMRLVDDWGSGASIDEFAPSVAVDRDMRRWWARWERSAASPGAVRTHLEALAHISVRAICPLVRVPTLVMHRRGDKAVDARGGRDLARRIVGSRYVELDGDDHLPMFGDTAAVLAELDAFAATCGDVPLAARDVCACVRIQDADGEPSWQRFDHIADAAAHALAAREVTPGARVALCPELRGTPAERGAERIAAHARAGEVLTMGAARGLLVGAGVAFDARGLARLGDDVTQTALFTMRPDAPR